MRRFIFPDSYYVDKFNASNYCEIVIDNYYAMQINLKNIQNNDDFEIFNSMVEMEKHLAIITSFSAMTLESFCNYYLLLCLGKNKFEIYEKLNLHEKIDFIFTFILESNLKRDEELYCLLKNLVKERNALIHNKCKSVDKSKIFNDQTVNFNQQQLTKSQIEDSCCDMEALLKEAKKHVETIVLFLKKIDRLDNKINAISFFFGNYFCRDIDDKGIYKKEILEEFKIKV